MKYAKILSTTLALGTILAGCQKSMINKTGMFTTLGKASGRAPASANTFEQFQDPKQIYIYCHLNDMSPSNCYKRNLEDSLRTFARKNNLGPNTMAKLQEENSYAITQEKTNKGLSLVFERIQPSIDKLVEKRVGFCQQNATVNLDRCLKQYLKKETFQVLNAYQDRNAGMNGHEYLFLKNEIETSFLSNLKAAKIRLDGAEKKKL